MNRSYNIVWNATRNMYVVASELAQGDCRAATRVRAAGLTIGMMLASMASANAADLGPQSGASIALQDGDTVTLVADNTTSAGVDSTVTGGSGVQIDGKAVVNVTPGAGQNNVHMYGVLLDNGVTNNLGDNTEIHATSTVSPDGNIVTGLMFGNVNTNTNVNANGLSIVASGNYVEGIRYGFYSDNAVAMGTGGSIVVNSTGSGYGVMLGYSANDSFSVDRGLIHVTNIATQGAGNSVTYGYAVGIASSLTSKGNIDLGKNTLILLENQGVGTQGIALGEDASLTASELSIVSRVEDVSYIPMSPGSNSLGILAQRGGSISLGNNSLIDLRVNNSLYQTSHLTGIRLAGSGATLTANKLNISLSMANSGYGTGYGIQSEENSVTVGKAAIDLGSGSIISIDGLKSAYGISLSDNSTFAGHSSLKADRLTINIKGIGATGYGIHTSSWNTAIDLGSDSAILMSGTVEGAGIWLNTAKNSDFTPSFKADRLTVDVSGTNTTGFLMQSGTADLGEGSRVSANGVEETVKVTGGEFSAETLTVSTARSTGILAQADVIHTPTKVSVGPGSVIDGRGDGTQKTSGIVVTHATEQASRLATVDFHGSAQSRNAIYAVDGDGATARNGQALNISNTDIVMSRIPGSATRTTGLLASGAYFANPSARNGGVINAENLSIDMRGTGQNGSGVVSENGGLVNLSGNTSIKADGSAILGRVGGTVRGTGVMDITGNVDSIGAELVDLDMAAGSRFTGATSVGAYQAVNGVLNLKLADQAQWTMTGDSTLTNLTNGGHIVSASTAPGRTLSVSGDYVGNDGALTLNAQLDGDDSLTDRVEIAGNTSGRTFVAINNVGGQGASTVNGIELITVGGSSEGTFEQSGRIVAGQYDYFLVRGQNSATSNNWYLTNSLTPITPDPSGGDTPVSPESIVRPEAGSYMANQAAANTLFVTRLHDRLGETQYTDVLTGERRVTSMWLRQVGGHNRIRDNSGQLKTQSNRYVVQMGGDVAQWSGDDNSRLHVGLMAGYANSQSNSHSSITGYRSRGHVDGYSVGTYGTWYANEANKTGAYLDGWIQYAWFKNRVNGDGLAAEKYRSKGFISSLEAGYSAKIGEKGSTSYWIQPKAQATWMGVRAEDHREANGTMVKDSASGNLLTRLGVRAYAQGRHDSDADKQRQFQPFVELNWLHQLRDFAVTMDGEKNRLVGTKNVGELKLGVEGQINANFNVWGNVGQQIGTEGYSDTSVQLGVKFLF